MNLPDTNNVTFADARELVTVQPSLEDNQLLSPKVDKKGTVAFMSDGASIGDTVSPQHHQLSTASRSKARLIVGKYTIGTFLGEEWIFFKKYRHREETCVATEPSCVLEITVESFEAIRQSMLDNG